MSWRVMTGHVLDCVSDLHDASVQTVVTSPPYWGLRDYGTGSWEGGDAACDHDGALRAKAVSHVGTTSFSATSEGQIANAAAIHSRNGCPMCGASRVDQQIGLDPTPEAYVERLVEVFRDVRRVLRDDGTVWLNLGDSYNAYNGNAGPASGIDSPTGARTTQRPKLETGHGLRTADLKPKDLVGIPWMVAFALRADGWYLRSDIIWSKPNPMPESVTDRPTKAHEYVFLLSKSARYYFDADAVKSPVVDGGKVRRGPIYSAPAEIFGVEKLTGNMADDAVWTTPTMANIRSVWNIATEPFPGAHFATFPKRLVEPCVKAGSAAGDTVLDPFCGSGTVGLVAARFGRSFVGIELNPEYAEMARNRIRDDGPLFNIDAEVVA